MSEPSHGISVVIKFERLSAEGVIVKEYIGTLEGDAQDQNLYTKSFPITTSAGVTTDDETLVNVYTDDGTPGSWTEYADDGSDFTIDGSEGLVTIKAAENQAGNVGERISIDYYTTWQMARGQSFDLEAKRTLLTIHKLGSADPQDIVAGEKPAVRFNSVDLWLDRRMFGPLLSESDFYKLMTDVKIEVYPAGEGSGETYFVLSNVKWENVRLRVSTTTMVEVACSMIGTVLTSAQVP